MSWYEIKIDADGDIFMATAPAFPEVTTFGEDMEAALKNARDAIEEAIAGRIYDSEDIPLTLSQTTGRGYFIQLPVLTYLKAGLYMVCREAGVSRAELARRLKWHREQVDRLFRLDHNSKMDQIQEAFDALGITISVSIGTQPNKWAA